MNKANVRRFSIDIPAGTLLGEMGKTLLQIPLPEGYWDEQFVREFELGAEFSNHLLDTTGDPNTASFRVRSLEEPMRIGHPMQAWMLVDDDNLVTGFLELNANLDKKTKIINIERAGWKHAGAVSLHFAYRAL